MWQKKEPFFELLKESRVSFSASYESFQEPGIFFILFFLILEIQEHWELFSELRNPEMDLETFFFFFK